MTLLFDRLLRRRRAPAITPLAAEHAGACARLHREAFAYSWSEGEFERLLAASSAVGDGARQGGDLVAFVLSRHAADEAEILSIAVRASARRQGLGGRLLEAHLARLARLRIRALFLEVAEDNPAARALYDRHGFIETGRRKAYYGRARGPAADALVLRRTIEPAAPVL